MALARTQYADVIEKVGGYYNFVTLINRRLKELRNGEPPMVESSQGEDEIDLVVREIEAGLLVLHGGNENH
jgi:DNA-directed RNA polymerase subunit K/omega